ncbi:MAG: hypothetical protein ACRDZV_00440 [Acidimicrobiia bacterium]
MSKMDLAERFDPWRRETGRRDRAQELRAAAELLAHRAGWTRVEDHDAGVGGDAHVQVEPVEREALEQALMGGDESPSKWQALRSTMGSAAPSGG